MQKTNWILGFLAAFLLGSVALALTQGQILTQQQLNEVDAQTAYLDCKPLELVIDGEYLTERVSCLKLSTNAEGNYVMTPSQNNYTYPIKDILDCTANQPLAVCQQLVKTKWQTQHAAWVQELKNEIAHWKNQPSQNFDLAGFGLTNDELNQGSQQ